MYIFNSEFWAYFAGLNLFQKIQMIATEPELTVLAGVFIVGLFIGWRMMPKKRDITHGSAEWGTIKDAEKAGYVVKNIDDTQQTLVGKLGGKVLGLMYHTLIVAKARGGKGVGYVIPNLLKYRGSVICNDIKGENYTITSGAREKMGQNVYKFDPYGYVKGGESHRFNPLDYIHDCDPEGITRARDLADIIAGPHDGGDSFFSDYAKKIIVLWTLYVCVKCDPEKRNLRSVRDFIALPQEKVRALLAEMANMPEFFGVIMNNASALLTLMGGEGGEESKTYMSVQASADVMTAFLDDPRVADSLSATDFKMETFKYIPSTLYIIVEAANLNVSQMLLKMIYTYAIKLNMTFDAPAEVKELGLKAMDKPLKFFMDEFAQLGRFDIVKQTMPLSAGYGVWFCIIVQDITQLKAAYKESAGDFFTNATRVFIGAENEQTAKVISESCGKTTVKQSSYTVKPGLFFDSKQLSCSSTGRELLTVGEAMQMPVERPILIAGGVKPLKIQRFTYFKDAEFKGLFKKFDTF